MEYNKDIMRQLIIDHYENPRNKILENTGLIDYTLGHNDSPSCIDNIDAYVKVENDIIKDIKFIGVACAICTSSTDLMIKRIIGSKISEAHQIINNYKNMILANEYDEKSLDYLIIFRNVNKQANRVKCALTGIEAIEKAINNYEK